MWLDCAASSDCDSWSLDLSRRALLPSGAGRMDCRAWTPALDLLGWEGGHLLFMLMLLSSPLLFTFHTIIWFTIWKALLRLTLKSFCPFRGLGWLVYMILSCRARWPQGLLYLVSREGESTSAVFLCHWVQGLGLMSPGLHWENKTNQNCKMWNMNYIRPESSCQFRRWGRCEFDPWVGTIPWRRKWQPIPLFLPEESHGERRLAGYSPRGHKRVGHDLATNQQFDFIM